MNDKIDNMSQLNVTTCNEISTVESNTVEVDVVEITIEKTANCYWTVPGGVVTFCNKITNPSDIEIYDSIFIDELDDRFEYVPDSFMVDGVHASPLIIGRRIQYAIAQLRPETEKTICFKVKILPQTQND